MTDTETLEKTEMVMKSKALRMTEMSEMITETEEQEKF